ncbi:hypothetical protein JCM15519_06410 [Fundidesulfovibrio butyratiphilus]
MILVGTPCYAGTVTVNYMISLFNMVNRLGRDGLHVDIMTPSHESLITRARNFIANEFVRQEEYSHLLFIDSDIGFAPEVLLRYLEADKDIACGIYPLKHLDVKKLRSIPTKYNAEEAEAAALSYTVKFKLGGKADNHGFRSVEYGSTGFMLIKRHVFTKMIEAYPELKYHYSYASTYDHMYDNYAFFDTFIDPETREYLPEDYAFCKRWTALGGEVYADTLSTFTHVGTRAYTGNYPVFLNNLARKTQKESTGPETEPQATPTEGQA